MRISLNIKTKKALTWCFLLYAICAMLYYGHNHDEMTQNQANALGQSIGLAFTCCIIVLAPDKWIRLITALLLILMNFQIKEDIENENYKMNIYDYMNPVFAVLIFLVLLFNDWWHSIFNKNKHEK